MPASTSDYRSLNSKQALVLASKPLARMRQFASLLGWHDLRLEWIVFSDEEMTERFSPEAGILAFYMTTDLKFNLQINERPRGEAATHQATIKADRYGITHVGWHLFLADMMRAFNARQRGCDRGLNGVFTRILPGAANSSANISSFCRGRKRVVAEFVRIQAFSHGH